MNTFKKDAQQQYVGFREGLTKAEISLIASTKSVSEKLETINRIIKGKRGGPASRL